MPKVSPAIRAFNAGEFSVLMEAREDHDKYPAALRRSINFIPSPQGPILRRSGTEYYGAVYDHTKKSTLKSFIFSDEQAIVLEWSDQRLRFFSEFGLQTYEPAALTDVVTVSPFVVTSATLAAEIGDEVVLSGFPASDRATGRVAKITAKAGNNYTLDMTYHGTAGAKVAHTVARVYHIDTPYTDTDAQAIKLVQDVDVVYLFCDEHRVRKLSRYDSYDWRIEEVQFKRGPFMPQPRDGGMGILSADATGNLVPDMTAAALPAGQTISSSTAGASHEAWKAFDNSYETWWEPTTDQVGTLTIQFTTAQIVRGYTIYAAPDKTDATNDNIDYAPSTWEFKASNNGVDWVVLDTQTEYILYDSNRSVHFELAGRDLVGYTYYRLDIKAAVRNGAIKPRVARLVLTPEEDHANTLLTLTLTGNYVNLNKGAGFLETDEGRAIRLKASDGFWRYGTIENWNSATSVEIRLETEPLSGAAGQLILNYQIGYWSDTLGWPTTGAFFDDRLWMAGVRDVPNLVCASRTSAYEDFEQRAYDDVVADDHAIVGRINSRKLSRIRWIVADDQGLIVSTGSNFWYITSIDPGQTISARSMKARNSVEIGSADVEPVKVDKAILFVDAARRNIRELSWVYEADGYRAPSMTLLSQHLGNIPFTEVDYQFATEQILWCTRSDGSLIGLTYNRDENVIGAHRHFLGGDGLIESLTVIPSTVENRDTLWLVVRRTIDGEEVGYIERLQKTWEFGNTLDDVHFVDSATVYDGAAVDTLWVEHLNGETVDGLFDGKVARGLVVEDGAVVLPYTFEQAVVGKQYTSLLETARPAAGAADGTALGKAKRPHLAVPFIWDTAGGEIGRKNDETSEDIFDPLTYRELGDEIPEEVVLITGMLEPHILPEGYGESGSLIVRQTDPLPMNIIALFPQMHTQDR